MSPLVLDLEESDDPALVGGKAAGLCRLRRLGFPAPPGLVITVEAYRLFLREAGLEDLALHGAGDPGNESLEERARQVAERIREGSLPGDLAEALSRRLSAGRGALYSVRSSAIGEDAPGSSFAGQYRSFLGVPAGEHLLAAVRECWASLWTAESLSYRRALGGAAAPAMAVIVQEMVPAEVSGVLFTINPVTADASEVVVNAAWGLGEGVVSGLVAPDTVVADKATGAVKSWQVGHKGLMVRLRPEGGTEQVALPPGRALASSVTEEQVGRLARLGRSLEEAMGGPQDAEFAFVGEALYLLQARAVTGLGP